MIAPLLFWLLLSIADRVFFFAGAFQGEAALLEDANGSGEMRVGVGEDRFYGVRGFDSRDHGLRGFDGVAAQTELGEDGVADFCGVVVVGPTEATDGADEGGGLVVDWAKKDVPVPADIGGILGEGLLEELEDVRFPVGVGPLRGDMAVEDLAESAVGCLFRG
jgi:hypothetical protein